MLDVSATYESLVDSGYYEIRVLIDGTEYTESNIMSLASNIAVFGDSGEPELGKAVARTLDCTVRDIGQTIPEMAVIQPQYRITDGTTDSEWVSKGTFYIDTRQTGYEERTIILEAFDGMMKADVDYQGSVLSWPATDADVVAEIAGHMGVQIDARTTAAITEGYSVPFPEGYTMREVLGNIAAMYAGCFILSDEGKLLLVTLYGLPDVNGLLITEDSENITVDGGGIVV